jgi:hypothetical protein
MQQSKLTGAAGSQIRRKTPIEGAGRFGKLVNSYNFNELGFAGATRPVGACTMVLVLNLRE